MPERLRTELEDRLRPIFAEILAENNTAENKAAAIAAAVAATIVSELRVVIPPGLVVIQATGGVLNPYRIGCEVSSK